MFYIYLLLCFYYKLHFDILLLHDVIMGSHLSLEPVVTFIPQMASATFQSSDMILIQANQS